MHLKRLGTSKVGLLFNYAVCLALTLLTCIGYFRGDQYATSLTTLTSIWYGGATAYSGFYLWKAKNENRHKYAQRWINDLAKEYGIETAISVIQITKEV